MLLSLYLQQTDDENWQAIIAEEGINDTKIPNDIFPFKGELSETVNGAAFEKSFLIQPDLFLRMRPGKEKLVEERLRSAGIKFEKEKSTIRTQNNLDITAIIEVNRDVVVQDLSSQKIASYFDLVSEAIPHKTISVYDCCAASGGKSILANDVLKNIQLTVSDIRPSIIANLKKRFYEAGIGAYRAFAADLTEPVEKTKKYDLVIADVPCTGSGTWSRTPEQLFYFNEPQINHYAHLQRRILNNVVASVAQSGFLMYITCSVFKKENEEQVKNLQAKGFVVVKQGIIAGYHIKADTMFAALLKKC